LENDIIKSLIGTYLIWIAWETRKNIEKQFDDIWARLEKKDYEENPLLMDMISYYGLDVPLKFFVLKVGTLVYFIINVFYLPFQKIPLFKARRPK
jgi:hypothetical protein